MSSMRNAIQRRNHKERAQPKERSKWGLLEKHKDYSLRAKDHNVKKRKLKALQQKASERNEDEFYFGMMRSQTHGGRKIAVRGEENSGGSGKSLSLDVVKLMKTQDGAYLRTVLSSTRRSRERLQKEVLMLQQGVSVQSAQSGKVLFDDYGDEQLRQPVDSPIEDSFTFDDLPAFDEDDLDLSGSASSGEEDQDETLTPEEATLKRRRQRNISKKQRQLEALQEREQSLQTALREVEDQRARMNGTAGGVNKAGVKFKARERRR